MPRRNDGDNRYDAYLDMMRESDKEYVGECHGMDCEPYDGFIDILEDDDGYADYHDARVRWSAWISGADAHERRLLLEKEQRNMAQEREYILRARLAVQGVYQTAPCHSDELYWLRYQYCVMADELEKYRASSHQMMTRDAWIQECNLGGGVVVSMEPDIESSSWIAVQCAEWVLANE